MEQLELLVAVIWVPVCYMPLFQEEWLFQLAVQRYGGDPCGTWYGCTRRREFCNIEGVHERLSDGLGSVLCVCVGECERMNWLESSH